MDGGSSIHWPLTLLSFFYLVLDLSFSLSKSTLHPIFPSPLSLLLTPSSLLPHSSSLYAVLHRSFSYVSPIFHVANLFTLLYPTSIFSFFIHYPLQWSCSFLAPSFYVPNLFTLFLSILSIIPRSEHSLFINHPSTTVFITATQCFIYKLLLKLSDICYSVNGKNCKPFSYRMLQEQTACDSRQGIICTSSTYKSNIMFLNQLCMYFS